MNDDEVADARAQAGVAAATASAYGSAVTIRAQAGYAAATATAYGALAISAAVAVVADTIEQTGATTADVQAFADVIAAAVRDGVSAGIAAARIEQQAPMFGAVGRWLQANQGLLALLALVASIVYGQIQVTQDAQDQPANEQTSQVQVDRGDLASTTEKCLREQGVEITPPPAPSTEPPTTKSPTNEPPTDERA